MKTWQKLLFFLVFILALILRLVYLDQNPTFISDEASIGYNAYSVLKTGKDEWGKFLPLSFKSFGEYKLPAYIYLTVPSIAVFGLNEFALRFPSVVFGILTIWAIFLLGREMFDRNVGLVAAFFTTFLKIEILWSRQARPYQALQFFSLLGAWFIYKLTKEEKFNWRYLLGFLFCGFLASLMHGLGLIIFFCGFFTAHFIS